jgi:thiol:disulfide interchange protein DsbC
VKKIVLSCLIWGASIIAVAAEPAVIPAGAEAEAAVTAPQAAGATPAAVAAQISGKLKAARPDLEFSPPVASAFPGLYEVQVGGGPLLYVSADGEHFIAGDHFVVGSGGFVNIAEQRRQVERRELLAAVKPADMIVFAPENPKATLTVFTDVDCGYCRKLHQEVPELNKMGIAVHYLAFPRAGIPSESYNRIATVWCSDNRQDALTRMKKGENLPVNVCPGNPVAAQYALGERVGVSGTPALVLEDGTLVPGYQSAAELAQLLGIH